MAQDMLTFLLVSVAATVGPVLSIPPWAASAGAGIQQCHCRSESIGAVTLRILPSAGVRTVRAAFVGRRHGGAIHGTWGAPSLPPSRRPHHFTR